MQEQFTRQAESALELAKNRTVLQTRLYWNRTYFNRAPERKRGTAGMVLEEFGVEEERLLALIEKLIAPPDTGTAVAERAPNTVRVHAKL